MANQKPRSLAEYPIVIEPLAEVLEVKVNYGQKTTCEQLHRWRVNPEHSPTIVNNLEAAHVFGNAATMDLGSLALAYDAQGVLRSLWWLSSNRGWLSSSAAEEITGLALRQPAVRHTFADAKTQKRYVEIIRHQLRLIEVGQSPLKAAVLEMFNLLRDPPSPMTAFDVGSAATRVSAIPLAIDADL